MWRSGRISTRRGDPALIAALGDPAAKLDWDFGTLPCPGSEFVYPDRGITLFLGTDHDRVFHVALYAATSLENYVDNLRPGWASRCGP